MFKRFFFTFHLLLQNQWPILIKLGTKHPWVKGIPVCSNEGPHLPRGNNYEIANLQNLKSPSPEEIAKKTLTKFNNFLFQNHCQSKLGFRGFKALKMNTIQLSKRS